MPRFAEVVTATQERYVINLEQVAYIYLNGSGPVTIQPTVDCSIEISHDEYLRRVRHLVLDTA